MKMFLFYYVIFLNLLILYSYEIIEVLPFEYIKVQFNRSNPYYIFKYRHVIINNNGNSYFSVKSIEKTNILNYQLYAYLEEKDIKEKNGEFIDYDKYGNATDYFIFSECINHEYYVVIKCNFSKIDTLYFFSTDSPYEIKNNFSEDYPLIKTINRQSYIFSISSNYTKYIKFGLSNYENSGKSLTQVINKNKNTEIFYEKDSYIYTDYFELNENIEYYFNFSLFYNNNLSDSMYFLYLMKSNYSKITEVKKKLGYDLDYYPIIDGLYFLLDVSSNPKGSNITFEYDFNWYNKKFEADGYTIDNLEIIDNLYDKKQQNLTYNPSENSKNYLNNIFDNDTNIRIPLIVEKEECYRRRICKGYIIKNNVDLKKIVLIIPKGEKDLRYIKFRYVEEEKKENEKEKEKEKEKKEEKEEENESKENGFKKEFLFTFLIGLMLTLPNILWQIIRKCRNKMTASAFTLIMNIIINFGYGNFFGYFLDYGNKASMIVGIVFLSIYSLMCLISLILQSCGKRAYFDVIFNLCDKLDDSKSLNEMISINRKLFPITRVGCYAQHEESREVWVEEEEYDKPVYRTVRNARGEFREVFDHYEKDYRYVRTHYSPWGRVDRGGGHFNGNPGRSNNRYTKRVEYRTVETWRKELDYFYKSWQDNTKNIDNIKYCSILEATFSYHISCDQNSQNTMNRMKDDLYTEGKKYDTDVHTYNNFTVPGFTNKHTCPLNESEYKRIQKKYANCCGYIIWFILFVLGYSSIFEAYSRYEIGKANISIYKYVSSQDDMRMPYKTNEIDLPGISISFVHTKLQMKSLEKKLEKGEIDKKDIDIPLILVN